jgi:hypothetical protein
MIWQRRKRDFIMRCDGNHNVDIIVDQGLNRKIGRSDDQLLGDNPRKRRFVVHALFLNVTCSHTVNTDCLCGLFRRPVPSLSVPTRLQVETTLHINAHRETEMYSPCVLKMEVAKEIQSLLHDRCDLRVACVSSETMDCKSMLVLMHDSLEIEFDVMVFVNGRSGVFSKIQCMVLGKMSGEQVAPHMIVVAPDHFFAFTREDPCTIPAYLLRWHEKKSDPSGWECVVCMTPGGAGYATCPICACKICIDCFPSLVYYESEACHENMFQCPQCRKVSMACDVLHVEMPCQQMGAKLLSLWSVLRSALSGRPDRRSGLVLIKLDEMTLVADASMGADNRVHIESPHWRLAVKSMKEKGTIIGVGSLPEHGRSVGAPALERFDVDPLGRAYLSMGKGRVLEIDMGWKYICGVHL